MHRVFGQGQVSRVPRANFALTIRRAHVRKSLQLQPSHKAIEAVDAPTQPSTSVLGTPSAAAPSVVSPADDTGSPVVYSQRPSTYEAADQVGLPISPNKSTMAVALRLIQSGDRRLPTVASLRIPLIQDFSDVS